MNQNIKFKKIIIASKGGPEVLRLQDSLISSSKLRADEILVAVEACGIAFGDRMRRLGLLAPPWDFVPGYDAVGRVISAGEKVATTYLGMRVAIFMPMIGIGGYSQIIKVKSKAAITINETQSAHTVLALGLNYVSAYQLLSRFKKLAPGSKVFVQGISGNVGMALLDLAAVLQISLSGTCSASNKGRLEEALVYKGVSGKIYDYRDQQLKKTILRDFPAGFDLALDGFGGDSLVFCHSLLGKDGLLVSFGISQDITKGYWGMLKTIVKALPSLIMDFLFTGKFKVYAIGVNNGCKLPNILSDWSFMLELLEQKRIEPLIGESFEFQKVHEAHQHLDQRHRPGKIILYNGAFHDQSKILSQKLN